MANQSFIALPYTSEEPTVTGLRVEWALKVAAALIIRGEVVVSPVLMGHPMIVIGVLSKSPENWSKYCRDLLSNCDRMYVLELPGWEKSDGLMKEIEEARRLNISILRISQEMMSQMTKGLGI